MFGYVTINKPELKIREYQCYQSYYCGLCHCLKEQFGPIGQLTLSYDMTFLVLLLSSLYEPTNTMLNRRCIAHPGKKRPMCYNSVTQYAAGLTIILAYYNFMDDWKDEKKLTGITGVRLLHKAFKKASGQYPDICKKVKHYLQQLSILEKSNETSLDKVAGTFGELMACLFDYKQDIWSPYLQSFGFYLGKFVYIMDACLDVETDIKNGSYTPLSHSYETMDEKEFNSMCQAMLETMIADATGEFEKLPLNENIEIMRNILYAGVWNQYNAAKNKKQPS